MMLISEVFSLFIIEKQTVGIYDSTIRTYKNIIENIFLPDIGDIEVIDITLQDLQRFIIKLRNKDISVNTVNTYWRHVKAFLRFMYKNDFIEHDLSIKIPPMKGYNSIKDIYLDDEIILIFNSIHGNSRSALQKRAIFALLLDTGMRQSEICNIEVSDISFKHKYINIRGMKSHSDRKVPISMATVRIINKYMIKRIIPYNSNNQNLLFSIKNGNALTTGSIVRYVKTHVKDQGIKRGNTHLFRHTFITRKCLETNDAFYVQQLAGHSDLDTTRKYYQYASGYQVVKVNLTSIDQLLASIKF